MSLCNKSIHHFSILYYTFVKQMPDIIAEILYYMIFYIYMMKFCCNKWLPHMRTKQFDVYVI